MHRAIAAALIAFIGLGACASSYGRSESSVVFTHYTPLSRNAEIAQRVLPPLTYRRMQETAAARKLTLADQAIDLAKEKFDIYIPPQPPPGGYGLLVYIAPWQAPTHPGRWRSSLDRRGLIFVAAQNAGNETTTLDRRLPLALLAYENVRARFPIDANRVYVAGLSGGSRVAEIAALAYPDIFRGAILNAGADPIDGEAGIYKPSAQHFAIFQHSRLVYITGDKDEENLMQDTASRSSMRDACVFDTKTETAFGLAHQPLDLASFDRALDALEQPRAVDAAELARCNARVESEIAARLADAAAAIARGDRGGARTQLLAIEAKYGGLAAPGLLDLDAQLATPH